MELVLKVTRVDEIQSDTMDLDDSIVIKPAEVEVSIRGEGGPATIEVTYARKAAGLAAVEHLDGKKADNDQILRVTMRKTPVFHSTPFAPTTTHVPSVLSEPIKMLSRAVKGSINNVGSLYQEQLQVAQHILKVQQHRMAQLRMEEQRIQTLRTQGNSQFEDLTDDMF
ncbi:hypothetical protein BGZ65_006876 [Modicella reniformis]|uniref:Uncharacterized protein n=1 Tax=Modicella reniformis TaxID=1440133 RepID=A0A9P6MKC8_9FUNG|nr:hypothetical protein BGZ65_006876 [Modicella reniformis]